MYMLIGTDQLQLQKLEDLGVFRSWFLPNQSIQAHAFIFTSFTGSSNAPAEYITATFFNQFFHPCANRKTWKQALYFFYSKNTEEMASQNEITSIQWHHWMLCYSLGRVYKQLQNKHGCFWLKPL